MGVTTDVLLQRQDELARAQIGSLNAVVHSDDDAAIERIDTLAADDRDSDPESSAIALAAKEILGVTESRVCQLHAQILKTLRAQLKSDEQLFSYVA
jgi:RNA polymerase sigma factor FliA